MTIIIQFEYYLSSLFIHFLILFNSQMKLKVLLLFSSFVIGHMASEKSDERQGRVLNRRYDSALIEKQLLQEYSELSSAYNSTATDASPEDVIEEIIESSRQNRNIEGLDEVYSDSNIKEALNTGNEIEARNLIRDKLCALGLMQCDEVIHGKRPGYPTRVIYSQPPPNAMYSNRPPPHQLSQQNINYGRPPPQAAHLPPQIPSKGIYGPARPMPFPPNQQSQPPRKIGYAHSELNTFGSSNEKYSTGDFFQVDPQPSSSIKFGYTEKPTIVVNQGKREASQGGVSQNHHVHHHYVHVDGSSPAGVVGAGGLIDGAKTVLVNTPISEYSAVNSLSSTYQTSGFGASDASSNLNGFTPSAGIDYKGVNSGSFGGGYSGLSGNVNSGSSGGIYSGSSIKPVYENSNNQYASGTNFNKYQQTLGPQAVYTEGTNGIYSNSNANGAQQSFHSSAPEFYKKELNLNNYNRGGNGLISSSGAGYSSQQQQTQQNYFNSQKQQQQQQQLYSKNQYNSVGGEQYQGFESSQQNQFDCVCVPFDQCPASDVVGRRDDLILPLDPRHLPTEIEADNGDNHGNLTVRAITSSNNSTETTEVKKISKRSADDDDDIRKVQGEGVSTEK